MPRLGLLNLEMQVIAIRIRVMLLEKPVKYRLLTAVVETEHGPKFPGTHELRLPQRLQLLVGCKHLGDEVVPCLRQARIEAQVLNLLAAVGQRDGRGAVHYSPVVVRVRSGCPPQFELLAK